MGVFKMAEKTFQVEPDRDMYTLCLNAWASNCSRVFSIVFLKYSKMLEKKFIPGVEDYNSVFLALVKDSTVDVNSKGGYADELRLAMRLSLINMDVTTISL